MSPTVSHDPTVGYGLVNVLKTYKSKDAMNICFPDFQFDAESPEIKNFK